MRARNDPGFIEFLMKIGNGEERVNCQGQIRIPQPMLIPYTSIEQSIESLISSVYPDMSLFEKCPFEMVQQAILCPKNEFVDDFNSKLIQRIQGNEVVYISDDRAKNVMDQGDYVDYLNSLEPRGLPQNRLVLKVNCPVILLRNINPVEGLSNGTRLIFKRISPLILRQISLRLCFVMTINKLQGQMLDYVGMYLRQPVFTHGQLYVALSRAKTGENVNILIVPPTFNDPGTEYTRNVVYTEVLAKESLK
ncbi:hypothetical protein LIER_36917 [Lithospermum erythrorhizon]|uniref:DNA helicase Pif1-like 2B domain-containing protein n=1 Tax=Lithospermum erythrorhizon TaxID=34254 RepID=A0AAV3PGE9_LITER